MRSLNLSTRDLRHRQRIQRESSRVPNTHCDLCERRIYRRPSTLALNAGKFCSRSCRNKNHRPFGLRGPNPKLSGRNNPAWSGGVTLKRAKGNYRGVRYVHCPPEWLPMARKDGYIAEHRLVMAQSLGRCLTRTEVVHHIDHNPSNNLPTNLLLFPSNAAHKGFEGLVARLNRPMSQLLLPASVSQIH